MRTVNFKPEQITKAFLADLPERSRTVIEKRFGLDGRKRQTLESIGTGYGITRERVRQIENIAKEQIRRSEVFVSEAQDAINDMYDALEQMGGVAEERSLLDVVSPSEEERNSLYLMLELGEPFSHSREDDTHYKTWHTNSKNAQAVKNSLNRLYQSLDTEELLTEEEILLRFVDVIEHDILDGRVDTEATRLWLEMSKRIGQNQMGRWGRTDSANIKTRGVRDYAYLVLREHGKPMHFRDIATETSKYFDKKINVATIHNELIKDPRFALVGRGLYALQDWGLYGGTVAELITEILQAHTKPMREEDIVEKVLERKIVKESTIRINLKNKKRFVQDKQNKMYSLVK